MEMNKRIILLSTMFLILDQILKILVNNYLNDSINIINNFFKLNYVRNTGASWGILSGNKILLIIISIIILCVLIYFIKNFKKNTRNIIAFSLLIGGILGNLIDRICYGYVIDYLDFNIFGYNYPVFNLADTFIVIGVILLIVAIIRGEDNANSK